MSDVDGEKTYPIYTFEATWHQLGESKFPAWKEGLADGRIWNSITFDRPYKMDQSIETLRLELISWWDEHKRKKMRGKKPSVPIMSVKFKERETWFFEWFQHSTFDVGQTDQEALDSFERFVHRKQRLGTEVYCLMGADDRWRWRGNPDSDSVPCRCKHCKKHGLLRISH